jgi:hypothetical protein
MEEDQYTQSEFAKLRAGWTWSPCEKTLFSELQQQMPFPRLLAMVRRKDHQHMRPVGL